MMTGKDWNQLLKLTPEVDFTIFDGQPFNFAFDRKRNMDVEQYIKEYWHIIKDTEYASKIMAMMIGEITDGGIK